MTNSIFKVGGDDGAWRLILPLYVTNGEESVKTFALLDGGANRHVVSKDICQKLKLKGKTMSMRRKAHRQRSIADGNLYAPRDRADQPQKQY